MITIQSSGQEIVSTNYWDTDYAERGFYFLSINAGAFRLLVPDDHKSAVKEWLQATEVIISRGPWPEMDKSDAFEILFEDNTDYPYAIQIGFDQVDRIIPDSDRYSHGQPPRRKLSVWTRIGKVLELPCRYRIVKSIPWLKPWE